MNSHAWLFVVALLVTPVSVLAGVATGAVFTFRLMKGMPPIPPIPRKAKVIEDTQKQEPSRAHPPRLHA